jgi:hypothetical protein
LELDTSAETGIDDWNYIDFIQLVGSPDIQPAILTYPNTHVIYFPHAHLNGEDHIAIALSDCLHDRFRESDPYVKNVQVNAVNDVPIVSVTQTTLAEGTEVLVNFDEAVVDYDGDVLTYRITSLPPTGSGSDVEFFQALLEDGVMTKGEKINVEDERVELGQGAIYVVATGKVDQFYRKPGVTNDLALYFNLTWDVDDGVSDVRPQSVAAVTLVPKFRCASEHIIATVGECKSDGIELTQDVVYGFDDPVLCGRWEDSFWSEQVNEKNIPCDHVPASSSVGALVISVVAILSVVSFVTMLKLFSVKGHPKMRARQPIFLLMFLAGSMALALSLLTLLGGNEGNCMLRVWAVNLGAISMFSPLLPKLWRAYRVLDNRRLRVVVITNTQVTIQVLKIIAVDVLILALWSYFSPEHEETELVRLSFVNLPIQRSVCVSDVSNFATLSLLYKALLLMAGCYVSYKVRGIDASLGEMKPMLLTIYNISVFAIIVFLIETTDPTISFALLIKSISVLFVVIVAQAAMIISPIIKMMASVGTTGLSDSDPSTRSMNTAQETALADEVDSLSEQNAMLKAEVKVLKMEIQALNEEAKVAAAANSRGGNPLEEAKGVVAGNPSGEKPLESGGFTDLASQNPESQKQKLPPLDSPSPSSSACS